MKEKEKKNEQENKKRKNLSDEETETERRKEKKEEMEGGKDKIRSMMKRSQITKIEERKETKTRDVN